MEGEEVIQRFNGVHFNYNSSKRGKYVSIHKIIKYSICPLTLLNAVPGYFTLLSRWDQTDSWNIPITLESQVAIGIVYA